MPRGIGALYGWLEKGAQHGARHQYFSNHFSRSSDGHGLRRLGYVQESFVTASQMVSPVLRVSRRGYAHVDQFGFMS
jgi:hypothetical protein